MEKKNASVQKCPLPPTSGEQEPLKVGETFSSGRSEEEKKAEKEPKMRPEEAGEQMTGVRDEAGEEGEEAPRAPSSHHDISSSAQAPP